MKRFRLGLIAAALAVVLPLPAAGACKPIRPKSWKGTISLAGHVSATNQSFLINKCVLPDPALNGVDARVFNVASHRGLKATASWRTATAVRPDLVTGTFYSAKCTGLPGTGWEQRTMGKRVAFKIPAGAKWLLVTPYTVTPSKDIAVTISSAGRKCRR
jgi:hypothetical protein